MKYFFILGRNPELSRAEIYSYLKSRNIFFTEKLFDSNILIVETKEIINIKIDDFGGILMFGEISISGDKKDIFEYIEKEELISEEKFTFNILGNYDLEEELYKKFRREKKKVMLRHGRGQLKIQGEDILKIPNADYHFFCFKQNKINFGLVSQVFSSQEQKYRDMKKPVRRAELAISPRLSRILINLAFLRKGDTLLDPFCGIGGIIQEALVLGINAIGIDKDKNAVRDAKKNLDWIKKEFKILVGYKLENLDSKNLPTSKFDGIATESSLGELVKRKINQRDTELFLSNFERLIIPILRKIKKIKSQNSRIAITFPLIKGRGVNINKILRETGLIIANFDNVKFPIKEFRNDQFVSREIFVFI